MKRLCLMLMLVGSLTGCITTGPANKDVIASTETGIGGAPDLILSMRIYLPKVEEGKKYPLCIYLHDTDGVGTDGLGNLDDGANNLVRYVKSSDTPSFILIPQCPKGKEWKDEDVMVSLNEIVTAWLQKEEVDKDRVYLTGFGMGGEGVWFYSLEFPDELSTIAPVCGGSLATKTTINPIVPNILQDANIWAIHYLDDRVRTPDLSKKILSGIWTQSVALSRLTEFPEGGHTADIYKNQRFMGWLFATRKATENENE